MLLTDWFAEMPLSAKAAAVRSSLSVVEYRYVKESIENLSMVTQRPIREVAERLLASMSDVGDGHGLETDSFFSLIKDICEENEGDQ